jgi:quercetin dioxygenase-like cupin family protein
MKFDKHGKDLNMNLLRAALILASASGLVGNAFAQSSPAPQARPLRVELPQLDVTGTVNKRAQGRYVEFPAGFKSPTAFHAGEELVYIISGDYTLTLEGQPPRSMKGGDSVAIPRAVRHGFVTAGGAKLVAFWVVDKDLPLDLNPIP